MQNCSFMLKSIISLHIHNYITRLYSPSPPPKRVIKTIYVCILFKIRLCIKVILYVRLIESLIIKINLIKTAWLSQCKRYISLYPFLKGLRFIDEWRHNISCTFCKTSMFFYCDGLFSKGSPVGYVTASFD